MATKRSFQSSAPVPERQYAQPGGVHVSLGWPIRLIAGTALTLILGLAILALFGWPSSDRLAGPFVFAVGVLIISILVSGIRVAAQWEQGVVLRLGRFAGLRGPGLFYIIPGVEQVLFVDRRLLTLDIPGQKAITKDNVPVQIDGALFFLVQDPARAVVDVQDYRFATAQYAQAALRDTVGGLSLDELLAEREQIQNTLGAILEQRLQALGVHVDSVRLLDVDVPEDLKRMMSRQASAEREKRATITKAEGDKLAALNLAEAAATMLHSPGAMQLRTLQTIDGLGASPSNTVILMPVELVELMRGVRVTGTNGATVAVDEGDRARGVAPTIIRMSGIPVDPAIAEPKPLAVMRTRHGFAVNEPLISLFGGGLDVERVHLTVMGLLARDVRGTLAVVAGRNAALTDALADLSDGPTLRLRSLGFISYVDDLVAASDLVITKAGGLIVSEVLARGTPLLLIDPIPGQEEWNADYVVSSGGAIQLRMVELVPHAVQRLLACPERLAMLRACAQASGRPRAALDIVEAILLDVHEPMHG